MATLTIPARVSDSGPLPANARAIAAGRFERFLDAAEAAGEACHEMSKAGVSREYRSLLIAVAREKLLAAEEEL